MYNVYATKCTLNLFNIKCFILACLVILLCRICMLRISYLMTTYCIFFEYSRVSIKCTGLLSYNEKNCATFFTHIKQNNSTYVLCFIFFKLTNKLESFYITMSIRNSRVCIYPQNMQYVVWYTPYKTVIIYTTVYWYYIL